MTTTRTRFAPSPTGFMHVGGIRTALFAYLLARQDNGQFVLRLEDTDKSREVEGSAAHLEQALTALGIDYDEGPAKPGAYGPYRQSDRLKIYRSYAMKLIEQGRAFADPYSSEQLQEFRTQAQKAKRAFRYRDYRPEQTPDWDGSTALRFKSDPKSYTYHDEVMGDITTSPEVVDDFILIKSDGYPTYNFAHIVDDLEMRISHIIRGQEFISSMANYLNLYDALGFDMTGSDTDDKPALPKFAHLPHIMNQQGNKKLGKRDGAKDVMEYIKEGYLPQTMVSFIATLGWNDGTEQEVFTKDELIAKFSLARVQHSGAAFDEKRLLWMNGQIIRTLSIDSLEDYVKDFWPASADSADHDYRIKVLKLAQDRLKTLADLPELSQYFFAEPEVELELITGNKQLKKLSKSQIVDLLQAAHASLANLDNWQSDAIQDSLNQLLIDTDQKPGTLFSLIRISTTWAQFSPQLNDTLELLGQQVTLDRLTNSLQAIEKTDRIA